MKTVRFRIARPQRAEQWQEFDVPVQDHTTVVDSLEWIRTHLDRTLMYRHSCHHGSCGTCGMVINGTSALACTTRVVDLDLETDQVVTVTPLPTMSHIGDLAVDPTPLFRHFPAAAGYLRPSEANRGSTPPEEVPQYKRFENCIECGLCVSVCPVINLREFMGPAALAAYNRELEKNPGRSDELLPQVEGAEGAAGCDRHLACSAACPTGVYPAKQIVQLRKKIEGWQKNRESGTTGSAGDGSPVVPL